MTITIQTPRIVDQTVGLSVLAAQCVVSLPAYAAEKRLDRKERRADRKYNKQIAASQAKIGEYKPATIPVQVWA
jgi:hypothetical protein